MQFYGNRANVAHRPAVNILESENGFRMEMAVPGFAKEDISIIVKEGVLTISGKAPEVKTDEQTRFVRREFGRRAFERSFRLNEKMDTGQVKATCEQGVLHLSIPKLVPEKKVIEVA